MSTLSPHASAACMCICAKHRSVARVEGALTIALAPCRALCAELAPSSQRVIDSFGIPSHLVAAPIAVDWEMYNKVDNQGELVGPAFD